MFTLAIVVAAIITSATAIPNKIVDPATLVKREPASTGPVITRPTNFQLHFTSYTNATDCTGNNVTDSVQSGKCVNLSAPAFSWHSSADVQTQQVSMNIYPTYNCSAFGQIEHLTAGSFCFSPNSFGMGDVTIKSVCVDC